ncbi:hypothetical protein RRG08_007387 [Elysia crispata]|uniref:Uncharacterized protein n=1 Tax=Elysia crispata TaxID=231223 RepID=A0AAE1AT70_9GAST|nr:hypothetical protein RRG08_007387 [Elysia crispata]
MVVVVVAFISDIQAEGGSRGGAVIIDFSATAAGVKKVNVVTADDPDGAGPVHDRDDHLDGFRVLKAQEQNI